METKIYNIDSKDRNSTLNTNSHDFSFTHTSSGNLEPFSEKNVVEMKITSIEVPNSFYFINATKGNNTFTLGTTKTLTSGSYTKTELITHMNTLIDNSGTPDTDVFTYSSTTGKVSIDNTSSDDIVFTNNSTDYLCIGEILGFTAGQTISSGAATTVGTNVMELPQEKYIFLQINDYGNIIHKNRRYVSKIYSDNSTRHDDLNRETALKFVTSTIKFNQPRDIKGLNISLRDRLNNLVDLNGSNFSFTLEVTTISNSILKKYDEMFSYSPEVMQRILNSTMLEYYQKQANNTTNNSLSSNYSSNIVNLHNQQEYNPNGNRMDHNYNGFTKPF